MTPDTLPGDLADPEWATLDSLLDGHATWFDGYLAGLTLQPQPLFGLEWLHALLGPTTDPLVQTLSARRMKALSTALRSQTWWDPFLRMAEDPTSSPAVSPQLAPWVAGFDQALQEHPVAGLHDPACMLVLARLYRHLPAHDPQEQALVSLLDQTQPLDSLEDAVDELTACVAELWDLTRPAPEDA